MMKFSKIFQTSLTAVFFLVATTFSNSGHAAARSGMAHWVGSGLAYSTLNHSLFVNPAAMVDSPKTSLQGLYQVDPEAIYGSAIFGLGDAGAGLQYQQNPAGDDGLAGGFAFRMNALSLGTSVFTDVGFDSTSVDVAANFDLSKFRFSVIGRGISDSLTRLDAGIGIINGPLTFGFDVKIPWGVDFDFFFFDAGLSYSNKKVSVGVGYTSSYIAGSFEGGDIHAGVSLAVGSSVALEGFYKPQSQEWAAGDVVVGARFML